MDTRKNEILVNSGNQHTFFKYASIPKPVVGQVELYLSVSEAKKTIKCILLALPKSLSPDNEESRIEYSAEYHLSHDHIDELFLDIENIFKKYPDPEKHFDSFNISHDSDSVNKQHISRAEATGIAVSNRYLEKILEIQRQELLSSVPSATRGCRIF